VWEINVTPISYTNEQIQQIVAAQRKFFRTGMTLPIKWRIQQLKKLKTAVIEHATDFEDALAEDLGRSRVEAHLCDVGPYTGKGAWKLKVLRLFER
jgi:aldehyde dehydrogenase (NAD+)